MADNVYVNIAINNATNNTTTEARFNVTYDQPILERPSDFYMGIVKFEIPLAALPIGVMPLVPLAEQEQEINALTSSAGGFISQTGTTVTGNGTNFNQFMVGGKLTYGLAPNKYEGTITAVASATSMTVSLAGTVSSSRYNISNYHQATLGSVTQVGTTITGTGTNFNQLMEGATITYADGSSTTIATYQNPSLMIATTPVAASGGYKITNFTAINEAQRKNLTNLLIGVCPNTQGTGSVSPSFMRHVIFNPVNDFIKSGDLRYPYVYTYSGLISSYNVALNEARVSAGSPGIATPYFSYDDSGTISAIFGQSFITDGFTVCYNYLIQNVVPSFNLYLTDDPQIFRGRYELRTNQTTYNDTLVYKTTPELIYKLDQDFQTLDYLNSVRKIVMLSSSIPLRNQIFPPPNTSNSGLVNAIPIITDFQLDLNNTPGAQRGVALFETTGKYNLIDLLSDYPMNRIDISLFWADENNNLYPIFITQNDTATIKIGFFSKELMKNNNFD